jgi:hypothetical protein
MTLNLEVSPRTIQREMMRTGMKQKKWKKKPALNSGHKAKREKFAITHLGQTDWNFIWFTDEKKFNLDGPDGFVHYWHDLSNDFKEKFGSKSFSPKKGIMVWGAICATGTPILFRFSTKRVNSKAYVKALKKALIPVLTDMKTTVPEISWKVIQDNAPIHRSKMTQEFLKENKIETVSWPPVSPDLNLIENVWGWLVRKVYEGGKVYHTVEDLWITIQAKWREIPESLIQSLVNSMDERLRCVLFEKGGATRY